MNYFVLIPVSISLGLIGLGAFFWALRHAQYDDLDGAAARVLNAPDTPTSKVFAEAAEYQGGSGTGELTSAGSHPH